MSIIKSLFKNGLLNIFIVLILHSAFSNQISAQNNSSDSTVHLKAIVLSEITYKYKSLLETLEEIRNESSIPADIINLDSTYDIGLNMIDSLKSLVIDDSSKFTIQRLSNLTKEWKGYSNQIQYYQANVAEHAQLLERNLDTLLHHSKVWELSINTLKEKQAPKEIITRIKSAIDSIEMIETYVSDISNHLIRLQDKLIYAQNRAEEVIDFITIEKAKFTGKLFVLDSPPIWKWENKNSSIAYWSMIKKNWAGQQRILNIFFANYGWVFIFHFIIFLIFIGLFRTLRRKYINADLPGDDQRLKLAFITIKAPFFSALALAIIISIYFYSGGPEVFFSLITLIATIPMIALFPKYVNIERKGFLYLIVFAFLINEIQEILIFDSLSNRLLQLLKSAIIAFVLLKAIMNQKLKDNSLTNSYWKIIIKYLAPLYLITIGVSVIANVFGAYQLSELLIIGIIDSTLYALLFLIFGVVTSSILVVILRSKYASPLKVFTKNSVQFEARISKLIYLYVLYLWAKITLGSFHLLAPIIKAYDAFLDLFWLVGGVKISVGGIMSFLVILIVTFLLAKLIKEMVNDSIFPVRKSTRGLPNAFSMVIRYMVVTLGVYVALAAAGINLSEFGLMAGALGVGLGFGLQNILHNLVSGLIVSFERPIHVGDTIQVDTLHGVVTEIGVRSSKIRTFDGSEVILPNGDLLSKQVINWTLSDQKRRIEIKVRTSLNANPHEVIKLLKTEIIAHPNVNPEPNAMCLFEGYGDSALNFRVLFWVDYNVGLSTKSDVALSIYDKLKDLEIEAPIHQQRLFYQNQDLQRGKPI